MVFDINNIRAQLTHGGARPTLFNVQIFNPVNSTGDVKTPFMVEATSVPAMTLGIIQVPYMGRKIKVPGDRTFEEWTVNVICDEDYLIKNAMEEWNNRINTLRGNLRDFPSSSPLQVQSEALLTQYSKTLSPIRQYRMKGLWPAVVGQVELSWNNTDSIITFPVTFAYDWFAPEGATGNAGGEV